MKIRPADLKRQFLLYQKNNSTHHTDSLCKNSGEGCSGCIQMESGNEEQITDDIDDTGNENKQQRWLTVSQTTEDRSHQVIGNDEENTASADADITGGQIHRFRRCLHKYGDGMRKNNHQEK